MASEIQAQEAVKILEIAKDIAFKLIDLQGVLSSVKSKPSDDITDAFCDKVDVIAKRLTKSYQDL